MKRVLIKTLFLFSVILLALSAFNLGVSGPYIGIPFLGLALVLAKNFPKKKIVYLFLLMESVFVVIFNLGLGTQPFLFPIIQEGGYAEVINNAYCYHDDSGFTKCYSDKKGADFMMDGNFAGGQITEVITGEQYKIISVVLGSTDFNSVLLLETEQGFEIDPDNYTRRYSESMGHKQIFKINKPVISRFLAIVNTPFTFVIPTIRVLEQTSP